MSQENVEVVQRMLEGFNRGDWTTFAVVRMRDGKISRVQAFLTKDAAIEAGELPK